MYDPELSGYITTLTVNMEVANFCVAMDTLIDQDDYVHDCLNYSCCHLFLTLYYQNGKKYMYSI